MADATDFVEHLRRQLGFLERSCASYDAGFTDEAIRIATIVRVLIHDTKKSVSLLKHLSATTINLRSTTPGVSPGSVMFMGFGMMQVVSGKAGFVPMLGDGPPVSEFIPVSVWWERIAMIMNGQRMSRKGIVLAAAHEDGGAHVDAKLTPGYAALAEDGAAGSFSYQTEDVLIETPFQGAHFVSLRQIGYELLHSPDLIKLAK